MFRIFKTEQVSNFNSFKITAFVTVIVHSFFCLVEHPTIYHSLGRLGCREGDRHPQQEGAQNDIGNYSEKRPHCPQVEGWIMPEMPGVMTDILISMDDRSRLVRIGLIWLDWDWVVISNILEWSDKIGRNMSQVLLRFV